VAPFSQGFSGGDHIWTDTCTGVDTFASLQPIGATLHWGKAGGGGTPRYYLARTGLDEITVVGSLESHLVDCGGSGQAGKIQGGT